MREIQVARDHRPGHTGDSPQDVDSIVGTSRLAGMMADFTQHYEPPSRLDMILGYPAIAAEPGYWRDDITAIELDETGAGLDPAVHKTVPTGKTVSGYDPNNWD
jgi:hypothetical protein